MFSELYVRNMRISQPLPADRYPAAIPAVQALAGQGLEFSKPVTLLVGENGSGKSTLLEALAVAMGFNAEGGSRNFSFSTAESHSDLCDAVMVTKGVRRMRDGFFLRAESFYNAASYLDALDLAERNYGGSLHQKSHGESFLSLCEHRFRGEGLYILDEPEAALSPCGVLQLMGHIRRLVGQNSQFIIATHSPMLLAFPDAEVLQLDGAGITRTDYRATEHYQLTRLFLNDPNRMLELIFGT